MDVSFVQNWVYVVLVDTSIQDKLFCNRFSITRLPSCVNHFWLVTVFLVGKLFTNEQKKVNNRKKYCSDLCFWLIIPR